MNSKIKPNQNVNKVQKQVHVTRREFYKIIGTFGLTSTLLGLSELTSFNCLPSSKALANSASDVNVNRYKKKPRFQLKLGTSQNAETLLKTRMGTLSFISDLESRTDGEVRVEFVGSNKLCNELTCVKLCQEGDVDIFTTTTQNAAHRAPYMNVLDFPYLWPGRAAQYHFFYHSKSEKLFREPIRKFHKLQFLFTHCALRGIMMGKKFKDQPKIMTIKELEGKKLRVTSTQLGRIAMKLLGTNPVPVAWKDTLRALQIGAIDGAETFSSACAHGMVKAVTQDIHCNLFAGNAHTSMNLNTFENLDAYLQDAVMESSYLTQVQTQNANEAALTNIIGITDPPLAGTIYDKYGVKNCIWPHEELAKAEQMVSPKYNPDPWKKWIERLSRMAKVDNIFEELYSIARQLPETTIPLDVEPRRWWKR